MNGDRSRGTSTPDPVEGKEKEEGEGGRLDRGLTSNKLALEHGLAGFH